jgi:hypothetical protein
VLSNLHGEADLTRVPIQRREQTVQRLCWAPIPYSREAGEETVLLARVEAERNALDLPRRRDPYLQHICVGSNALEAGQERSRDLPAEAPVAEQSETLLHDHLLAGALLALPEKKEDLAWIGPNGAKVERHPQASNTPVKSGACLGPERAEVASASPPHPVR